jgi:leucyl aminopeptidase
MIRIEFTNNIPKREQIWTSFWKEDGSDIEPPRTVKERWCESYRQLHVWIGKTKRRRLEIGAELYKKASEGDGKSLLLDFRGITREEAFDLLEGLLLSTWRFDKYRTSLRSEGEFFLDFIIVLTEDPASFEVEFNLIKGRIEGVFYARDLTSEPPNCLYPLAYANRLLELRNFGIDVEIMDEATLQTIGMTALLAAGQGSENHPCAVCLTWRGSADSQKKILLAGKGVCFDSGGLFIKPPAHQKEMKWDKAGAGVVAGVMKSLALNKCSAHVIGIIGLIENMPSGKAVKPGDVIKTMSGQTVEIVDTDAEGRLVLADCLWYGQNRFHPDVMIDLGTLTQETFASLGGAYAGLYCEDQELTKSLLKAGLKSTEEIWRLPMGSYFAKQIESTVADIKNLGEEQFGENGAAAEFLKRFVRVPKWAHLDISGVSWIKKDHLLCPKGATGFGVRLLIDWIEEYGR